MLLNTIRNFSYIILINYHHYRIKNMFPFFHYRRWSFMVPWIIIYGINILGLFTVSIVIFYSAEGGMKAFGIFPLCVGLFLLGTIHILRKHIRFCLLLLHLRLHTIFAYFQFCIFDYIERRVKMFLKPVWVLGR